MLQVSHDHGVALVEQKKQELMNQKKLVLILDLDNTLLHSKEIPIQQRSGNQRMVKTQIKLIDPLLSLYELWLYNHIYLVKLRPFFAKFFVEIIKLYEVYFYTAGNRSYGEAILDIFHQELSRVDPSNFPSKLSQQLDHTKLISRDDQKRF